MSDDLEFTVINDIPEYIFCIGDDEENERVIALSGKDGAFKYEKVIELPTTGEEGKLYLIPKAHATSTATGNPITTTVAEQAGKIESFQLDGDTAQQTWTGKNILPLKNLSQGGVNSTYNYLTGELSCSGTSSQNWPRLVEKADCTIATGTTVTFSVQEAHDYNLAIRYYYNSTEFEDAGITAGATSNARTLSHNITAVEVLYNTGSNTTISDTFKMMLEVGGSATTFEPYVGGQASPSPSYPQPIQTVTGDQTVSIIGKNLFNKNAVTNGGYIDTNGEVVAWETFGYSEYIRVIGGQTYSYSGTANNVGYSAKAAWYDSNKNFISYFSFGTSGQVTAPATAKFLRTSVRIASPSGVDTYQLELGSTITTYEAYKATNYPIDLGDIELCKIGDYRDYIYTDNGKWYIHKEIDSYTFKGDATVDLYEYNTDDTNNLGVNLKPRKVDLAAFRKTSVAASVIYSDKFGWSTGVNYEGLYITGASQVEGGYNGNVRLYIAHSRLDDYDASLSNTSKVALVKDWLANNNLTVYYIRNRSAVSDEEITDDGIIAQLEAVRTASLENGTNTITNNATAPNLAGDMEIGYYGCNPTNRYDKWIWLDFDNSYEQLNNPETTATLSTRSLGTTTEQTTPTRSVETVTLKKGASDTVSEKTELDPVEEQEEIEEKAGVPVERDIEETRPTEADEKPKEENSEQVETENVEIDDYYIS